MTQDQKRLFCFRIKSLLIFYAVCKGCKQMSHFIYNVFISNRGDKCRFERHLFYLRICLLRISSVVVLYLCGGGFRLEKVRSRRWSEDKLGGARQLIIAGPGEETPIEASREPRPRTPNSLPSGWRALTLRRCVTGSPGKVPQMTDVVQLVRCHSAMEVRWCWMQKLNTSISTWICEQTLWYHEKRNEL